MKNKKLENIQKKVYEKIGKMSIKDIATNLKVSLYQVRKQTKILKDQGYIVLFSPEAYPCYCRNESQNFCECDPHIPSRYFRKTNKTYEK